MKVELVTNELDVSYIVHGPFRWCNSRCLNVTICDSPHMKRRNGLPSIPIYQLSTPINLLENAKNSKLRYENVNAFTLCTLNISILWHIVRISVSEPCYPQYFSTIFRKTIEAAKGDKACTT